MTKGSQSLETSSKASNSGESCQSMDEFQVIMKELVNMIVLHRYPFSIVDDIGFRNYTSTLNPDFEMPSQIQVREELLKMFNDGVEKRKQLLKNYKGKIAVSLDLWTSHDKRRFVAATAHLVDDTWTLQSFLFRFIKLPKKYSEKVIMEYYLNCMAGWNLDYKISTLTVEDSISDAMVYENFSELFPSNSVMVREKFLRMRCFAHALMLLVKEGLAILGDTSLRIRNIVDYWTATAERNDIFHQKARLLNLYIRGKELVLNCETRWDSTYVMLERALYYKDVFKDEMLRESGNIAIPSDEDWSLTEKVCGKLKLIYETALLFSEKNHATAILFFAKVCDVKLALLEWAACDIEVVREMALNMKETYDEYWNCVNTVLAVAAVLDPRYKMYIVEYYYQKIYGDGSQGQIDRIRNVCSELLEEYQAKMKINELGKQDAMSAFDLFLNERKKNKVGVTTELDYYLDEDVLPRTNDFNVISWWHTNGLKYPTLQSIAKDVLAIPVSKVDSGAAFCTVGRVLEQYYDKLGEKTVEALMCRRDWLISEIPGGYVSEDEEDSFLLSDEDLDNEWDYLGFY